jgi:hypothetical protein
MPVAMSLGLSDGFGVTAAVCGRISRIGPGSRGVGGLVELGLRLTSKTAKINMAKERCGPSSLPTSRTVTTLSVTAVPKTQDV